MNESLLRFYSFNQTNLDEAVLKNSKSGINLKIFAIKESQNDTFRCEMDL